MMGENEHGCVIGRLLTPPSPPALIPRSRTGEHVPSHDVGAGREDAFELGCVGLRFLELPPVQELSALAQGFRQALVRASDESVKGDGQIARDSAHAPIMPPLGGPGPAERPVIVAVVPLAG